MKTEGILKKLAALRSRIRTLVITHATLQFLTFAGALAIASFVLDRVFRLPFGARLVMLLMTIGCMIWGARKFFLAPLAVPLPDDDLALLVERRHPEFGDHLISAIELERDLLAGRTGESKELIQTVVNGAAERFKDISFADAVSAKCLKKPSMMSIAAVLIVGLYGSSVPADLSLWFRRCILLQNTPWPPRTRLVIEIAGSEKFNKRVADDGTLEYFVPEGSMIRLAVHASGELPSSVQIRKFPSPRKDDAQAITIDVASSDDGGDFEYKFARVTSSFEFFVTGGDAEDPDPYFRILVRSAPRLQEFGVDYDYPDYVNAAGEADKSNVREYNIAGPVGTEVTMHFKASMELDRFRLVFDDKEDGAVTLTPDPADPTAFTYAFTLSTDRFYTYRLVGQNGAQSKEAPNFSISAAPDLAPQIAFVMPETTTLDVTANAAVFFKLALTDDYRVGKADLRWDPSREGAFGNLIDIDPADERERGERREVAVFKALDMKAFTVVRDGKPLPVQSGDAIYVKVEAFDTRKTKESPDPNRYVYPTPVSLNVREPVEIERELVRTQVRLKDDVRRVLESLQVRIGEIDVARGQTARIASDKEKFKNELFGLLSSHDLGTSSLLETSRGYVRVFDGYVFNRLEATNLTESLITAFEAAHKKDDEPHYVVIGKTLPGVRAQINDGEAIGKVTRIMDLLMTAADLSSPAVGKALKAAAESDDPSKLSDQLDGARGQAEKLQAELVFLLEKMEEWEDFQDLVQGLKDIIDLEKGLGDRIKKAAK